MTSTLQKFSYSDTEARFLELVIRLGGYSVRRQFNQFAACQTGKRTHDFVQKLLTHGHARKRYPVNALPPYPEGDYVEVERKRRRIAV